MTNMAYVIAVVSETGEESLIGGGIRRTLFKVRCYDSFGKISTALVMLSELGEIKKATGISVGDVVFFSATVREGVKDLLVFHPNEIYVLRKGMIPAEELSEKLIDARLLPYRYDHNVVLLEGRVSLVEGDQVCIIIGNREALRGSTDPEYHIWVRHNGKMKIGVKTGAKVSFVGELSDGELKGRVYV